VLVGTCPFIRWNRRNTHIGWDFYTRACVHARGLPYNSISVPSVPHNVLVIYWKDLYKTLDNVVTPMKDDNKVPFTGPVTKYGGSYYMLIRPELVQYLNVGDDTELELQAEHTDDHGRYISAWNPDQQDDQ